MRLNYTKEFAKKWRAWLHKLWFAPPDLMAEQPRKWWNLIATAGMRGRASGEQWNKLFEELNDILTFAPNDPAGRGTGQLHIVSDDPVSDRLLGRQCRAARVSNWAKGLAERPFPSAYVQRGWGARQLANAIATDSAKGSELGRAFSLRAADLGLSAEECDAMGPRAKR